MMDTKLGFFEQVVADDKINLQFYPLEVKPQQPVILPDDFKQVLHLESGGRLIAIYFGGMVLLVSKPLSSLFALDGMGQALQTANISFEDWLVGVDEIRTTILKERYGLTTENIS